MDAAGARVLAERLAEAGPRPAAPVRIEPARPSLLGGRRRRRPRARIEEWIDIPPAAAPVDEPAAGPEVWIGAPPAPASSERWFFYERRRELTVAGERLAVVESVCTKLLPSGPETSVVARRPAS